MRLVVNWFPGQLLDEMKNEEKGNWVRKKQLGLCQSQNLALLHDGVDCVECARSVRMTASEYQSSVCCFPCVRVFIISGFIWD